MSSRPGSPGNSRPLPDRPVFALDESFPQPIVRPAFDAWDLGVEVRLLQELDGRLTGFKDHELILALHQRDIEGLITTDDAMVFLPEVLAIIEQVGFSVVTCRRAGDDPAKATGLLLVHLERIGKRHEVRKPQIWRLDAAEARQVKFGHHKTSVETRTETRIADHRLTDEELRRPILPPDDGS